MKLSVVIPCRNAAPFLAHQLEALARQHAQGDWEVLVADNASTDGSREVARAFADHLPGFSIIDATGHRGPGGSRNAGAAAARGEALVFCDADDEVGEGWLAAMEAALAEHPFVSARYDAHKLNPPQLVAARGEHQHLGLNAYTYPPFLPHAGGGGLGIHRQLFLDAGGFDEGLPALEDTDLCWRLQLAGTPLTFVPEALVHIRFRPDLRGMFRQTVAFGLYNVVLYERYRNRGMPRLSLAVGLAKWAKLLATAPLVLAPAGRARWLAQLAWRWGRLKGCVRERSLGL